MDEDTEHDKPAPAGNRPWSWVPSLYFAEGLPYVIVMTVSVIVYKRLGLSNTDVALYTSWLYLPWVLKPLWSPLVDIFVGQMIKDDLAKEIKPETCGDIAEVMELVAPLPPENIGGLAGFLARVAGLENPPVCGAAPANETAQAAR